MPWHDMCLLIKFNDSKIKKRNWLKIFLRSTHSFVIIQKIQLSANFSFSKLTHKIHWINYTKYVRTMKIYKLYLLEYATVIIIIIFNDTPSWSNISRSFSPTNDYKKFDTLFVLYISTTVTLLYILNEPV